VRVISLPDQYINNCKWGIEDINIGLNLSPTKTFNREPIKHTRLYHWTIVDEREVLIKFYITHDLYWNARFDYV